MSIKSSSLLCLALLLACSSAIDALDITKTLGEYPEFSTFTKYITETKLVEQINSRNTITVLAVENPAMQSIASKSPEAIKAIISTHVILDYFDEKKLNEAQGNSQQLPTLFQASGNAVKNQGFLKVTTIGEGGVCFTSTADGASADAAAELMRTVTTVPYNISVLQVNKPIVAPGVDSQTPGSSDAKAPASPAAHDAKAPAPAAHEDKASAPAQSAKAPAPATHEANASAPAKSANAPAPAAHDAKAPAPVADDDDAKASSPSETSTAPSPAKDESAAESPKEDVAETPATSPIALEEDVADAADTADAADAAADNKAAADTPKSSASTMKMGLVGAGMTFASLFIAL